MLQISQSRTQDISHRERHTEAPCGEVKLGIPFSRKSPPGFIAHWAMYVHFKGND